MFLFKVVLDILNKLFTSYMISLSLSLCGQIETNIFEPQGISYVDASATFMTNDLLPLLEKTVTDKKVHSKGHAGCLLGCFFFCCFITLPYIFQF